MRAYYYRVKKPTAGEPGELPLRCEVVNTGPAPARDAAQPCPERLGRVACVDLTHQTMCVQQDKKGRQIFDPVQIRTGKPGYPTGNLSPPPARRLSRPAGDTRPPACPGTRSRLRHLPQ